MLEKSKTRRDIEELKNDIDIDFASTDIREYNAEYSYRLFSYKDKTSSKALDLIKNHHQNFLLSGDLINMK